MSDLVKVRKIAGKYFAWIVMNPDGRIIPKDGWLARFHEFEDAIAYADRMSRQTTTNGDKK